MKPGSHEPDNYSIDEIIERLKKPESKKNDDSGELVTREDGTQVIRVRKRKRRSRQPQREREKMQQKRRFVRILTGLGALILIMGVLAGGIIYSNSLPFRESLREKITATTGAEVELNQFRMNPTGANANLLTLHWPDGFPIASLQARGVRASTSIHSFFGGNFHGDELQAGEGTLTWRAPSADRRGFPSGLEKGVLDFQRISVSRFHLVPDTSLQRQFRLRNSEASFYPNIGTGGRAQMRLNGGDLQVSGLPKLNLDRAFFEFRDDEIHLSGAKMHHGADRLGELTLSGRIPALDHASNASLAIEATAFNIEGVVGERMARIITGRIDSSRVDGASRLQFPVADPSSGVMEIDFKSALNSPMQFKGFNFLAELAMLLEEPWFEQPYFESDVTGIIRRSGGAVELRGLQAEHRNRMALRGNLRLDGNGRLNGKIDVGLSPALVATAPTRRLDPIISDASGGYRWISIEIGGTINAPTDNFMAIVDNPPSRTTTPAPIPAPGGGGSFEDLTRPR